MSALKAVLAAGVVLSLFVASAEAGEGGAGKAILYPADIDWIKNAAGDRPATAGRVVMRFDLRRVRGAERMNRAVLHLVPLPGQVISKPVEVCPVKSDWGGLSAEFRKHENEWVEANLKGTLGKLVWEQTGRKGREIAVGQETTELIFRVGEVNWEWAAYPVLRWAAPGGDLGKAVGVMGPGPAMILDVTDLAKSWAADDKANFGIALMFADENAGLAFDALCGYLRLEGAGLDIDKVTVRPEDHPAWLPKTYRAEHPRLCHPDAKWMDMIKEKPALLETPAVKNGMGPSLRLALKHKVAPTEASLNQLVEAVAADEAASYKSGWGWGALDLPILYDWVCDSLPEEELAVLALQVMRLSRHCHPMDAVSKPRAWYPLWRPLAAYPDFPGARRFVLQVKLWYVDTSLPLVHFILGDHGGYWQECAGPYLTKTDDALCQLLAAWPSATGEDLFAKNPWLEYTIYPQYYGVQPNALCIRYSLDEVHYRLPRVLRGVAGMATQRYNNPYGPGVRDGLTPTARPWGPPLAKDLPEKKQETLPLVYGGDGEGIITMRSDWTEDATFVFFKCGITGRAHNVLDTGHFAIYKRAPLTQRTGTYNEARYAGSRFSVYFRLAIAANLVVVRDPGEKPFTQPEFMADPLPNDGGQRWSATSFASGTPYSLHQVMESEVHLTSKLLAFQPGKEFTYVCGDLTPAYTDNEKTRAHTPPGALRSQRVRKFLRTLLFLPPDHLLIFDQVDSFNKDFEKTWVMHTVHEPKIDGDRAVVEYAEPVYYFYSCGGLKYALSAPKDHPFFKQHPDCKWTGRPQLYQYDGIMYVRTLLPEKARLSTVGGPGKEFWVEGENYGMRSPKKPVPGEPDTSWHPKPYDVTGESGIWRLEVRPDAPREEDCFLHVFQMGIKSQNPTPTESKLLEVKEGTGVEVDLGGGRKATVSFKKGVGGHIRIEGGGQAVVDQDLAETVLPNLPIEK